MNAFLKLRTLLFGKSLNPAEPATRKHMLLIAFLAWVGLGADSLSSACYGPEVAFLALGNYPHLALYLALAIMLTVFVIALGYNQVIALFPFGGGGYKVATQLIHPYAGLIAGVALIVDYILTICVSIAACVAAFFSLLPLEMHPSMVITELVLLTFLGWLNLRGIKESIKLLLPIFVIFFTTHAALITYGIFQHLDRLPLLITDTYHQTLDLSHQMGIVVVIALFLKAYSLGAGTYTGIEAISNNVHHLSPPRVKTGQWAMGYMAFSLSFTAGGIILLYLLWNIHPTPGLTLNAITFKTLMQSWVWHDIDFGNILFFIVMGSEAGLLLVAANTGYLGGPTVLANMASDRWVPLQFRHLSFRLVTQNGIILFYIAAFLILLATKGRLDILIIMYSINVFITFSLSLYGLSVYWLKAPQPFFKKASKLFFSVLGFLTTAGILLITLFEKFSEGGWFTLLITTFLIFVCLYIKKQYSHFTDLLKKIDAQFKPSDIEKIPPIPLDPTQPTAVLFISEHIGLGMYTLEKVLSLFPNQYKNFIFLSAGEFNTQTYHPNEESSDSLADVTEIRTNVVRRLSYFVNYCRARNLPAVDYQTNDVDIIEGLTKLAKQKSRLYPNSVFFASSVVFPKNYFINHWLHNHTAQLIQERLQEEGLYMMLLPIHVTD